MACCTLLIHSDPKDITETSLFLDVPLPIQGALLVSEWIAGVSTTFQTTTVEDLGNDVYRFHFNEPAPPGHQLQLVWEDTMAPFTPQKSFTIVTKGFILSCECGCAGNAPAKIGEVVSIIVDSSIDPSGIVRAMVEKANRAHDDPSRWVYQLGILDSSITLTKALIKGFTCS